MANYDLGVAVGGTNQQIADAIKGVVDSGQTSSQIANMLQNPIANDALPPYVFTSIENMQLGYTVNGLYVNDYLTVGQSIKLTDATRHGDFTVRLAADYTAEIAVDTLKGVYVEIGDGTYCAVRECGKKIKFSHFYSNQGNTFEITTIFNELGALFLKNLTPDAISSTGVNLDPWEFVLDCDNKYRSSNELILYPGTKYTLDVGNELKPYAQGQRVVRSATSSEIYAATETNYYSTTNMKLIGGGIINGDGNAACGLLLDTIAARCEVDVQITGCTYRKYTTTGTGVSGSKTLTVTSSTNISIFDTIQIGNDENNLYTILNVNGSSLTLTTELSDNFTDATVAHRAVGCSAHMAQQSSLTLQTFANDINEVYGYNIDGYRCTDLELHGISHTSMQGVVLLGMGGSNFINKTMQQCWGSELIIIDSLSSVFSHPYLESRTAAQAVTETPLGSTITVAELQAKPMVDIRNGVNNTFISIRHPQNMFRRLIKNAANDTLVNGVMLQNESLQVNPNVADEYAIFEQSSATGDLRVTEITPITPASQLQEKAIVDENGDIPEAYRASWDLLITSSKRTKSQQRLYGKLNDTVIETRVLGESSPRLKITTTGTEHYSDFETSIISSNYVIGESYPRSSISVRGINLGDGTFTPLSAITYRDGGMGLRMNLNAPNDTFMKIQAPGGTYWFLFVDDSGVLRVSNTAPADRNTDGVIVGSQA
jgi:hypothetical protein